MMKGYKTYTGIAIAFVSSLVTLLGQADMITTTDTTTLVTAIGTIIGTVLAIYGRYKAKK